MVPFRVNPVHNKVTTDQFFIDQRFLITLISTQTTGNSWCESYVTEGIKSLFYYRNSEMIIRHKMHGKNFFWKQENTTRKLVE